VGPALAQDQAQADAAASEDEIIVTGIRRSLANAQEIKRNSETVVDSITAQDIGALPDRSVTEALQRVPGVAINRFAGTNDPDHFSVEGSGVVVRGLNFVRSEFNGRDAFAAGVGGQALSFADVPSELLGRVDVFKNVTAEMLEGGLAGTVNLNTRKPFDNPGRHLGFNIESNYSDFAEKSSPTGSMLLSNTWETGDGGRFGVLGSLSYAQVLSRADGIQVTNFQTRDGQLAAASNNNGTLFTCRNPLPSDTDTMTLPPGGAACGNFGTAGADGFADYADLRYAPLGGQFRTQDYDRVREGQAFALQWDSASGNSRITAEFLRSHTTNSWGEHTFETAPDLSEYNTYPIGCRQNTAGPPAVGTGGSDPPDIRAECPVGYITFPGTGWRTASSGSSTSFVPTGGLQQSLSRRQVEDENTVIDFGINGRFKITERFDLQLDVDYTESEKNNLDMSSFGSTFADQELDLTGDLPVLIPHKPHTLNATWAAPNPALVGATDAEYFSDARVQFWRAAMDHIENSTGNQIAYRADAAYHFDDDSLIRRVKVGARYSDREQTVRYTTYNWGAVSEVWSGTAVSVQQGGMENVDFFTFENFFRGKTPGPVGGYYYNRDLIEGYGEAAAYFMALNDIWHNVNGAGASNRWVPLALRANVVPGTDFLPSEIQPVNQEDQAAYAMVSFGHDGGVSWSGNIGVRYVHTETESAGSIGVPTQQAIGVVDSFFDTCIDLGPPPPPPAPPPTPPAICGLGEDRYEQLQQWATGVTTPDVANNSYEYWLPSFNLKVDATEDLIFRFAVAKVLARPDNANIRNFLNVGRTDLRLTATAGNPFLKPATAWNVDATAEWYFADVGSLTFNIFYKDVENFFYQAITPRVIESNGITQTVDVRGPANFEEGGTVKGFEVAYQQTYDFLPGFLSGFGINANYSYIESEGLPNAFLNGGNVPNTSTIPPGNLPLEGLSKHNVNFALFYEKGPVSLRAAYNWRSQFLLTATDVIFPYYSIFNDDTGTLDASAFFSITDSVKIGVQGVNLLDEEVRTLQAYTSDPNVLATRSIFLNDRRFSFILRGNF
jgi:TonB-dependent receptor